MAQNIPLKIRKLEAILRRLPLEHAARPLLEEELAKSRAGHWGEQSINYHLEFLDKKSHMILQGLRLLNKENSYFQMDKLILSTRFFLILEVKTMAGTLHFDPEFNQLIRSDEKKDSGFSDPILQVEIQKRHFKSWLSKLKLTTLPPVHSFVVISNPSSIIKAISDQKKVATNVIRSTVLPLKIEALQKNSECISLKDIKKIAKLLQKEHTPLNPDIIGKYHIKTSDILTGIHCPECIKLAMKIIRGKWVCPYCNYIDKSAHLNALNDYYLLIGQTITNKEMRNFLHIPSKDTASRMLRMMNLPYVGELRHRKYDISSLEEDM